MKGAPAASDQRCRAQLLSERRDCSHDGGNVVGFEVTQSSYVSRRSKQFAR